MGSVVALAHDHVLHSDFDRVTFDAGGRQTTSLSTYTLTAAVAPKARALHGVLAVVIKLTSTRARGNAAQGSLA